MQNTNESEVARILMELDEVENLHIVTSKDWNVILQGSVEDMSELKKLNLEKLRKIKGINKTNTLIIASEETLN